MKHTSENPCIFWYTHVYFYLHKCIYVPCSATFGETKRVHVRFLHPNEKTNR